jgi:type VI secretion system secreted protein Hcp
MPGNAFIQFFPDAGGSKGPALKGESEETGHVEWIEIADWDWEITSDSSATKGQGSSVGKPVTEGFNFSHFYDVSSPVIMTKAFRGTTFHTVTVDMCKQTGTGTPQVFLQIVMRDVFITKVSTKGGEDGTVTQDISMTFKKVGMGYKMQKDNGQLASSALFARWNLPEQSVTASDLTFTI